MSLKKNVSEQEAALIFCQSGALEDCGSMLERIDRRFYGANADDMNDNDLTYIVDEDGFESLLKGVDLSTVVVEKFED